MKKLLGIVVLLLSLLISGGTVFGNSEISTVASAKDKDFANTVQQEKIDQQLIEIANKYDIGEKMSKKDEKFVKKHTNAVEQQQSEFSTMATKTRTIYGYKTNSYINGTLEGTVTVTHGIYNNSFGANFLTYVGKGTPTKITNRLRHVAYGSIGEGGTYIAKVQDKTISNSCSGVKACRLNDSYSYVAFVAYSQTYPSSTVYYSGGSLGVPVSHIFTDN